MDNKDEYFSQPEREILKKLAAKCIPSKEDLLNEAATAIIRASQGLGALPMSNTERYNQRVSSDMGSTKDNDNFTIEYTLPNFTVTKLFKLPYDFRLLTASDASNRSTTYQYRLGWLEEAETVFPSDEINRRLAFSGYINLYEDFVFADWRPKGFLFPAGTWFTIENQTASSIPIKWMIQGAKD